MTPLIAIEDLLLFLASNSGAVEALWSAIQSGVSGDKVTAAIRATMVAAADAEMAKEFPNG